MVHWDKGPLGIHRDKIGVMRPQKRSRGRNGGGNPYHNNNQNRGGGGGGPRPPHRSQTFDSNGPNVKIRGNAYQVYERYLTLAREAQSSDDRIAAENFFQHAEHYFRVMSANGEGFPGQPRPQSQMPTDNGMGNGEGEQPEEQRQAYDRQPQDQRSHDHQGHEHQDHDQQAEVQIQHVPPPIRPVDDEEFKEELDEPITAANRKPNPHDDDDQLPSFITGRPE